MSFSYRPFRLMALLSAFVLAFTLAACDSDDATDDADDTADADTDDAEPVADTGIADDPGGALADAVAAMEDWDGVALSIAFDADDAARASILEENPEDAELLDMVLNSSMSLTAAGDDDSGAVSFSVNVDGADVVEFYIAATGDMLDDLAFRVDLPRIAELADDPSMAAEFDQMIAEAAMFGLEDAAQALVDGEWVALGGLEGMMSMLEGLEGSMAETEDGPDPQQMEEAIEEIAGLTEAFVTDDADVSHVGSDEVGERLRVVADGEAAQRYLESIMEVLAANDLLEGMSQQEIRDEFDEIEFSDVAFDAWIADGQLAQMAVDLTAIEDADVDGEFLVVVGIAEHSGGLSAPAAAVTVDVMQAFGQMMGGMAGGGFEMDELDLDDFDLEGDDLGFDDDFDTEMSQEEIDMMLSFMECITPEEIEGFGFFAPELAEAAEQAIAEGTLEYC